MNWRLEEALAATDFEGLYIFAGPERLVARDDTAYPFRAEPYFKAWVPLTAAVGSVLKLVPGHRPELVYLQPEDFWQAPPADPSGFWTEHVDVRVARSEAEVARDLVERGKRMAAIGEPESGELFAAVDDPALLARLDFTRAWKTPYEVECMAAASRTAVAGHRAAAEAFAAGASEFELHEAFLHATRQRESELPYGAIVALGRHASILHYQRLDRSPQAPDSSFLLDAGVEHLGYASDVTRTWARHAQEFEALINSMDELQQALCRELRSGVDFVFLNGRAHELLAGVLVEHGLVTCGSEQALTSGITRVFLPHGLGHLLGLQVHDAGGRQIAPDGRRREPPAEHPFLRLTRVVEAGFVLTIEPGLYLISSLLRALAPEDRRLIAWDAVERLMPYGGIRVEDNVLVRAEGARNLTREAFAEAA